MIVTFVFFKRLFCSSSFYIRLIALVAMIVLGYIKTEFERNADSTTHQ